MTVTVTDVEEEGEVTLSAVQPKVAVELTASLEDSDGGVKDITWQWARSDGSAERHLTNGMGPRQPPTRRLRTTRDQWPPTPATVPMGCDVPPATASYTDRRGEQTAEEVSDNAVIANTDNRAPMFPDTETG